MLSAHPRAIHWVDLEKFFGSVEDTLLAKYQQAEAVKHAGNRGQNREHDLREFLREHLPRRYGVTKGEVVTKSGGHSHSADVVIYDALNCPVLYSGETAVLPIEGVYGIVEVKSTELADATAKIDAFKRLAPRDLSVISTREYVTVHRPSRPFGAVLGYTLANNSLVSLAANLMEQNNQIHEVNFFTNMVAVLGSGLLHFERVDFERGEKFLFLGTDEFVDYMLTEQKRARNGEPSTGTLVRLVEDDLGSRTFGRFFVYLLVLLESMRLATPELGRYLDPEFPITIHRES